MRRAFAILVLSACGDAEPCAELDRPCIALHVESETVERIDQLELDIVYGDHHSTTTITPQGVVELPLALGVTIVATTEQRVAIVAAGKLSGAVLGTGAATTTVGVDAHVELTIELAPGGDCVAGGHYCGGDKLAGDPDTLYTCNGGGVPITRGVCTYGCIVQPTQDDVCRGGGGTCVDGGFYCGGDKLDGDPQSLYRCVAGAGTDPMVCANGCVVAPPNNDDYCR